MTQFKVFRFDPEKDTTYRFDTFDVPWEKGLTVLEGLNYILDNLDSTLAYRSSCRAAVCGSCAMHINGKYRLACNTSVEALVQDGNGEITIRPLAHLPVYKDLVVDMSNFFRHYDKIKPYLIPPETMPQKELVQSPEDRKKIDGAIDCILCGSCYGSCPIAGTHPDYVGPHAIFKAMRFYNDSRDIGKAERLNLIADECGIFRCHSVFNCQAVCPKNLETGNAVSHMKMNLVWYKIKRFFGLA